MYVETYLESSRLSTVELFSENHKKTLFLMFDWVRNTPLV